MRTVNDCMYLIDRINNVRPKNAPELVLGQRNGYKAIDYKVGQGLDTIASGLTTGEAYEALNVLYGYLCVARWDGASK